MGKVLVVEDNPTYLHQLEEALKNSGYEVESADNPIYGFEMFAKQKYDLVISDLVLKEFDGIRFLTTVKNIDPFVNTMILTANASDETESESIKVNVDYYFDKSKSIPLIIEYIDALVSKRPNHVTQSILHSEAEGIEVELKSHEVRKNGEIVALTPREYQILRVFLENKYTTLSRQEIINTVWGSPEEEIEERIIDLHIKNIRTKLKLVSLITVRGYGYKWNE